MISRYTNTPAGLAALDAGLSPDESALSGEDIVFDAPALFGESALFDETLAVDPDTGEVVGEFTMAVVAPVEEQHTTNLATVLDEEDLNRIGAEIVRLVETDEDSRSDWYKRLKAGLEAIGVYNVEKVNEVLDTVQVKHPLLVEAATQFQARAMAELLPPQGPVKAGLLGDVSDDLFEQGRRVEMFMNYQITIEDRGYYDERDQMLFKLPFTGSEFDKQYYCPVTQRVVSRWVRSENFIVPYRTTSLEEAPRYTEVIHTSHNKYLKLVKAGFYREVDLGEPSETLEAGERAAVAEVVDTMQGERAAGQTPLPDREHKFYECHIDYDLPGFADPDGIALPYVITVDAHTSKVLSIYRNWREGDESRQKRVWYTHKKFLPGFGFYGFGLIHAIGGLGEVASRLVEVLLDSGAFASLQGGFKSKDAKLKGDIVLQPGQWQDTELTADELARAFYTPPFKEPSQTLFQLLGMIVEGGQRFAATTETMVGDAATTGPVGSMVAQIEQGSKVFSGIHKRLHKAFGDEFIHIAELNGLYLPESYPYVIHGTEQTALRADFDGRVDVVPVSDPNIFSSAQRLAIAQTGMQLVGQLADIADRREAALDLLRAIRHPNPERLFPKAKEGVRADPVTEGSLAMLGRPLRVFVDQDHQAHIMVHQMQMQVSPPSAQAVLQAHLTEHAAVAYRLQMQALMGVPLPPLDIFADEVPSVPPEVENQIAVRAAQAVFRQQQQQLAQQQGAGEAQQMQAQMQQLAAENQALQRQVAEAQAAAQQAASMADVQKEQLRNAGKSMDVAREQLRNKGKAIELAKAQIEGLNE